MHSLLENGLGVLGLVDALDAQLPNAGGLAPRLKPVFRWGFPRRFPMWLVSPEASARAYSGVAPGSSRCIPIAVGHARSARLATLGINSTEGHLMLGIWGWVFKPWYDICRPGMSQHKKIWIFIRKNMVWFGFSQCHQHYPQNHHHFYGW